MRLLVIESARWTVLGVCDESGGCRVASFLADDPTVGVTDRRQLCALIVSVAHNGPPSDKRKSRRLDGPIFELKTRSGVRVPYFFDEGRVVICTEVLRKPKRSELARVIARAKTLRDAYLHAKWRRQLVISGEDG